MATFSNTIKVNTTGAVNALGKLEQSLQSAALAMGKFRAEASKGLGDGFSKGIQDARAFSKEAENVSKRVGDSSRKAKKSVDSIGLSYKDVGRIIESQIIFSALSKLTQGFRDAADAAADFQEQVARISAIDSEGLGIDRLREEVEQLAIDLGRPIDEVGSAAFEALQNDLGTTSETFEILRGDAQKLALVTGGDLGQAVNALSSVYKTFGTELDDVDSISGQFFGTINAGRITLADLENSLGTLSPLAIQSNVGFKELTDSLATITLTGTKANVATTQLRNVLNKTIKPTEELSAAYEKLGVKGFTELTKRIGADGQQLGFVGALQALRDTTDGSEEALARMFNTIRSQLGVLNILTNDQKLYNKTADITTKSAENLAEALDGIKGTAAREAAENAAELEVIFTRLGDKALDIQNLVTNAFLAIIGGSEKGVIALSTFTIGMGGATIAVTKFGVAGKVAFPPVIAFLAIVGSAALLAEGIDRGVDAFTSLAEKSATLEVERLKAYVQTLKELSELKLGDIDKQFENTESVIRKVGTAAQETQKQIVDAFTIESGNIRKTEAALIEAFGEARIRILRQVEDAIKNIDDAILAGEERIRGFTQSLEDVRFEFSIRGLEEGAQAAARIDRATQSIGEALKLIESVGLGDQSAEIARDAARIAESEARAALSSAERAGNENQIREAQRTLESSIQTRIAAENRLINLQKGLGTKTLLDQKQIYEENSALAEEQLKKLSDARAELAKAEGVGASPEVIKKLQETVIEETDKARQALIDAGQSEVLKTFDLEEQFRDAAKAVGEGLDQTEIDWSNAINSLRDNLANATDLKASVELTARIQDLAAESGNELLQKTVNDAAAEGGLAGDQLLNTAQAAVELYKEQQRLADQTEIAMADANANANEALLNFGKALKEAKLINLGNDQTAITDGIERDLSKLGQLNKEQLEQLVQNLKAVIPQIAEDTKGLFAPFTEEQAKFLEAGVKNAIAAAESALSSVSTRELFDPANLQAAKELVDRITTEDIQDLGFEVDSEGFEAVNTALDEIKRDAESAKNETAKIGTEGARQAAEGLGAVSRVTNGLKSVAAGARSAYEELLRVAQEALRTAQEAANVNASNSSNGLFFGGRPLYRNDGGSGRGQDTIPAMLSPEEFVVNSKSARNFFPELQAINAGNAPAASAGAGDTNITIGDINVNSNSEVPGQTARDISIALKRELRRGTS